MIGRVIGNYKIECKLGEGGMGAVYKGVDTMLDREVAIKALRPERASQTSVVERFRSEAVTLAKLHHPNIATLYSLFRQTDELYMVLEFVKGETLDSILQRRGALPADEVIPVFCQILDGINHAHELGIVHRDIKPANMMLTEKGTLKVLDFGIARLLGSNRMTRAGNVIGTLEYMAPEQVKGQETDARTDIYALGMMLYEVLTGRCPFETDNEFELMKLQTEAMPPNPRSINPSIPQEVEEAIFCAIQKNPDARFQTAGEFREALLDAGFAAKGSMRRSTGPRSVKADTNPPFERSNSGEQVTAASETVAAPANPAEADSIKETRIKATGETSPPTDPVREIKETRLGGNTDGGQQQQESLPQFLYGAKEQESASPFSNLTWVHYASAGSGAAVILALLIIVPVVLFGGGSDAPAANTQAQTTPTPAVENKTPKITETVQPMPPSRTAEVVQEPELTTPINSPVVPIETATGGGNKDSGATASGGGKKSAPSGGSSKSSRGKGGGLTAEQKRQLLEDVLSGKRKR